MPPGGDELPAAAGAAGVVTPGLAREGGGCRRDRCASYRSEKAFGVRAGRQYIAPAPKTCFDGVTNQTPSPVSLQVCHAEPRPAGGMHINGETPGLALFECRASYCMTRKVAMPCDTVKRQARSFEPR